MGSDWSLRALLLFCTHLATRSLRPLKTAGASGEVTHLSTAFIAPMTTGFPLNVPTQKDTRMGRAGSLRSISRVGPHTMPVAWPPPMDLPRTTRSGSTPYSSCAPPGPSWKAHVSSKMRGMPLLVHVSLSWPSQVLNLSMDSSPGLILGCESPAVAAPPHPKPVMGFTMTQAISLARTLSSSRDCGTLSSRMRQSELKRSFPAPCITPSHHPW
mmetsp:Transcript_31950/g.83850  ORF Transcript_31950/g.83850 Transcript_31950/m.83850 type:complete len:213 (+) Transcript_31950:744-1382(+)